MFVRKKKNSYGYTNVVIKNKVSVKLRYLKAIGVSTDAQELERIPRKGKVYIDRLVGQKDRFVNYETQFKEEYFTEQSVSNTENILSNDTQRILNRIYQRIRFGKIDDRILKHLEVARSSVLARCSTM